MESVAKVILKHGGVFLGTVAACTTTMIGVVKVSEMIPLKTTRKQKKAKKLEVRNVISFV